MCGGADMVCETHSLMARRVGTLEAELVFIEDKFAAIRAAGGEPDIATLDLYGRLADRQRRLSDPLGWRRMQRDVSPTLAEIATEIDDEKRSAEDVASLARGLFSVHRGTCSGEQRQQALVTARRLFPAHSKKFT
jgi:hypothetical protein